MIRKRIVFSGWVQGVGFRYRARHAAEHLGATGWVRNEYDGSVTMEIQGTQEQIDGVIADKPNTGYGIGFKTAVLFPLRDTSAFPADKMSIQ